MEVVIYNKENESGSAPLYGLVEEVTGRNPVKVCSLDGLFDVLKSRISGEIIIVFVVRAEDELDALQAQKSKLLDARIIIILPEEGCQFVEKAMALHPRYTGYGTGNYTDVGAVLSKMIK